MKLGIDIDGVMYRWDKTARYMLREILPNSPYKNDPSLKEESSYWNHIPDQVSKEHWNWLWKEGVELGLFRFGHLYPGTIKAMRELCAEHKVILITHRPEQAVADTIMWLAMLNLPINGLHIQTHQEPKSLVLPQCDIYLDDKPENVQDLRMNTSARAVALMDQPWNAHYDTLPHTDGLSGRHVNHIHRVFGWDDFLSLVRSYER